MAVGEQRRGQAASGARRRAAAPARRFRRRPLHQAEASSASRCWRTAVSVRPKPDASSGAVADSTRLSRSTMRRLASESWSAIGHQRYPILRKNALDQIGTAEADEAKAVTIDDERVHAGVRRSSWSATGASSPSSARSPVVVVWHEGRAWAIEDRCPHLGFPLHQGTVECRPAHLPLAPRPLRPGVGVHARPVGRRRHRLRRRGRRRRRVGGPRPAADPVGQLRRRLADGLEHGLTLVIAKATLGLLEADPSGASVVATGLEHGVRYRSEGWGSGLTVLVAMANVLPHLDPPDRPLALVHALAFVSRDTRGHAPASPSRRSPPRIWRPSGSPTGTAGSSRRARPTPPSGCWPRPSPAPRRSDVDAMMFAAATDHVFIDEGHTLDFTNKAFEALALVGDDAAPTVLTSLVAPDVRRRSQRGELRVAPPADLAALAAEAARPPRAGPREGLGRHVGVRGRERLAWSLLDDDPDAVVGACSTPSPPGPRRSSSAGRWR